jgi:hypothetical protein
MGRPSADRGQWPSRRYGGLRFSCMARSQWSYETTGTVYADTEAVMAWWFHPDRAEDFLSFAEKIGALETSFEESIEDGARIRTFQWKDRRGWTYSHRAESRLAANGMAARKDDHFIAPASDVVRYKSPTGKEMTKTCVGRIEFSPLNTGRTKISTFHDHSLVGGTWPRRLRMVRLDRSNTEASFRDWIDRCQTTAGPTSDLPLDRD